MFRSKTCRRWGIAGLIALGAFAIAERKAEAADAKSDPNQLIGRWDLTVEGADGAYPSWLGIEKSGHATLVGSYVGRFGSARPVSVIRVDEEGVARFEVPPQWERRSDMQAFEMTLEGGKLKGKSTDEKGRPITFQGVPAPALKRTEAPEWGEPIALFDGKDMDAFRTRDPNRPNGWVVRDGLLINEKPGNDLVTARKFDDFRLVAEFRYPKGSNAGIYLRGRYEVQIEDNHGDDPDSHKIGGVYGFLTPSLNAAKPAGEWQTIEITLVGRVASVTLNGERIIDRQTIPGITGGAIDSAEGEPGPLMLQGDHGVVEYRKITLTPAAPSKP